MWVSDNTVVVNFTMWTGMNSSRKLRNNGIHQTLKYTQSNDLFDTILYFRFVCGVHLNLQEVARWLFRWMMSLFVPFHYVATTIQVSLSSPILQTTSPYHFLHASSCQNFALCEVLHFVGVPLLSLEVVMHNAVSVTRFTYKAIGK